MSFANLSALCTAALLWVGCASDVRKPIEVTSEAKTEVTTGADRKKVEVESQTMTDPPGLGNSTLDREKVMVDTRVSDAGSETTLERMVEHDAPGMDNDRKTTVKRNVKLDANGNLVRDEVQVERR